MKREQPMKGHGRERADLPRVHADGDAAFVGSKQAAIDALEERRGAARVAVKLSAKLTDAGVQVTATAESPAPLWIALTESGLSHPVTRGENSGKTLSHTAVVRQLIRVGPTGKLELPLDRSWRRDQLKVVAFVQQPGPGKVLGVAWVKPLP